jgi:hypothetical protein
LTTFCEALSQKSTRFIATIARTNGMGVDSNWPKSEQVSRIATNLTDPDAIRERLAGLSPPLEQLCLLGLAFHDRPAGKLFIPTDFIAYVSVLEPPPPPAEPLASLRQTQPGKNLPHCDSKFLPPAEVEATIPATPVLDQN